MKDYTVSNPQFSDTIQIPETTDTNHADNINHAPLQIYENTMVLRNSLLPEDYDSSHTYSAGDYVLKDGKVYRVLEEMSGSWDESKVVEVDMSSDVATAMEDAQKALEAAEKAQSELTSAIATLEQAIETASSTTLSSAESYTDTQVSGVKSTSVSATLTASGWSSDDPPTQKVTVSGLTASTNGFISLAQGVDSDVYTAGARAQLAVQSQSEDELEIAAFGDVPEVDIPISIVTLW